METNNTVHKATLTLTSVEGESSFLMEVDWGKPLRELLEETGEENLPTAHKMMAFIIDRIVAMNIAFNKDMSAELIEPETTH